MEVDTSKWSGEGTFTHVLLERLRDVDALAVLRVEDAPASRSELGYNFISNEIFIAFARRARRERIARFGIPFHRTVFEKAMSVGDLADLLAANPDVGAPDYFDEAMLQYLRTERIVPPYQTRGYKLVELVRIYELTAAGAHPA
jgi:hypothetical protein